MANEQSVKQNYDSASRSPTGKTFFEMTAGEKIAFLGKAVVMLVTGGFVYPNVFID